MSKKHIGCVTWTKKGKKPYSYKATDRTNARCVVMNMLNLPNFKEETLEKRGILHVYLDGHIVHPVDKVTSKLTAMRDGEDKSVLILKPKRAKNGSRKEQSIRMLDERIAV